MKQWDLAFWGEVGSGWPAREASGGVDEKASKALRKAIREGFKNDNHPRGSSGRS